MEVLRCVQCKGEIALEENGLVGRCLSCGSVYYFKTEKNARIVSLLNQANISRLRGDYDGAILAYKIALKEDETDADAYWGIALSTFGIEYIEDPRTHQFIPTCRRTIQHSILSDENYLNAIKYASKEQADEFERQAKEIDELQKHIKEKIKNEEDFDVFLCFKSTDDEGNATEDRFIARNIYNELIKRNIRTFFSEISLKDRLGQDYEPIIYKAIYTCKVFILIATNEENIQSAWVKNEWTRYRDRAIDEGLENSAFAVFKNIKLNALPPVFRAQGADLAKYPAGGYEIEIADNLEKRFSKKKYSNFDEKYSSIFNENTDFVLEEKVVDLLEKKLATSRLTFDEKLDRALAYDEIGNHEKAINIIDEIIDEYPRKAKGWFCKAKLLTYNYKIDIISFYLDAKLKENYNFNMENAMKFASVEEAKQFEEESKDFSDNLDKLKTIDNSAEELETNLELFVTTKYKIDNQEKENNDLLLRDKKDLEAILEDNENKMKEIRRHLLRKNYYIKNIPTTPNLAFSFFNFIGFIVILTALIGSLINLKKIADGGSGTYANVIFEFVILLVVGILPFILVAILRKQLKYKKVRSIIETDRNKLEAIKEETNKIKQQITSFDKKFEEQKSDLEQKLGNYKEQELSAKENIKNAYTTVKDLMSLEFVQNYITQYEAFMQDTLKEKISQNISEFDLLNEEKQNIIRTDNNNKKALIDKKPNYFSLAYENYRTKIHDLYNANKERINYIDTRLEELEIAKKVFEIQQVKTFSNENFFEGFIEDASVNQNCEEEVKEYNQTKDIQKEKVEQLIRNKQNNPIKNYKRKHKSKRK